MLLMDSISETAKLAESSPIKNHSLLTAYRDVSQRLNGAPRFLFADDATKTAVELTLGRPKVLREAMEHVIIPYDRLWVEWFEPARQKLRDTFKIDNYETPHRPIPQRVGFLLESDGPSRRSGRVTWAWISPGLSVPNIAPFEAIFDLDQTFPFLSGDISAFTNNLAFIWKDNPIQYEAFKSIWRTSRHTLSPWGEKLLRNASQYEIDNCRADVYGEYITVWAILILLTASRPTLQHELINQQKINKNRIKRGEVPLHSYSSVTLHLSPQPSNTIVRGPLGHARKSPRIHLVSSYLARRGTKHWIVQPYMRGKGETISRRVFVRS